MDPPYSTFDILKSEIINLFVKLKGTITISFDKLLEKIFLASISRLKTDGSNEKVFVFFSFDAKQEYIPILAPISQNTDPS